ncbi:MAG: hypothetical protein HY815_20270 [Candidatus Riflebacteria bacterium]|nr:hypothetical protein [Candidatus Riflebacteria bacterium]
MAVPRVWDLAPVDADAVAALAPRLGVSPLLARLLIARGLIDEPLARSFLDCGRESIHPHGLLKGIDEARDSILGAIARGEKITIFGDYDADGLTGASILYWVVRKLRGRCEIFIPHRNRDGYGASAESMARIAADGTRLMVMIDSPPWRWP